MSLQDKILKRKLKKKEKQKLKIIEDRKNNDAIEEDDDEKKTQEEFQIGSDVENHAGTKRKAEESVQDTPDATKAKKKKKKKGESFHCVIISRVLLRLLWQKFREINF